MKQYAYWLKIRRRLGYITTKTIATSEKQAIKQMAVIENCPLSHIRVTRREDL